MRSGSKYLALALDVRRLTDSLIQLVEEGVQAEDLNTSIRGVVDSLEGAGQKTAVKALRARGTFGSYPSVHAMNEVITGAKRAELIVRLCGVIEPKSPEDQKKNALEAIPFFDELERRALYHSNHMEGRKTVALLR